MVLGSVTLTYHFPMLFPRLRSGFVASSTPPITPEEAILSVTAWHSEFQDGPVFALALNSRSEQKENCHGIVRMVLDS